ncbi:MAG: NAD(P)H-hydrate epimerase, partial [Gammaproteobacteria bacterium]|nr:NAD(P)H-hydrate epimerase [Gammaproteobacteria bacterium]
MLDEPSPVELYCAAQVRAIDNQAIRVLGCEGYDLMCTAAAGAFRDLRRHWPQAVRLLVLCGPGNNGGDGFVLARLAAAAGHHVRLCALSPGEALQGDARTAHEQMLEQGGVQMADWHDDLPEQHDVVVDALFGTGLRRALQGTAARMVDAVNRARAGAGEAPASPVGVLALDIPSGLCADTGQPLGPTVVADVTSTFVALKRGLFTGRARDHVGRLCFHGLDVPVEAAREQAVQARLLRAESVRGLLPRRAASAHKGRFGHVLALGGNHGYAGAVRLCAEAALRAGAGLV